MSYAHELHPRHGPNCENIEVRNSLRSAVVDSPISVVAIAVLLLWSLDSAVQVLGWLWFPATDYLATVIATLGSPYSSYSFRDQVSLSLTLWYAFEAIAAAVAAWLLSRWAFGLGPLRALGGYRT